MPRIRRQGLPPRLLDHLLDRASERNISASQFKLLADWLRAEPVVPEGKWFKRFPGLIVCGEGELIKTFLQPGQIAAGEEIH
jgi:GNAT superfamily N-acetyltransferase